MNRIFSDKLKAGDVVRVIAPARSLSMRWINNEEMKTIANRRFADLGLELTFGEHIYEIDDFNSSSITSRLDDLHAAFTDEQVKMIITVIGGFNSNQLLKYIDYDLITKNPKILCGYSDITALANAIFAKTGLVTYSGPHYFSFGDKQGFEYTLDYFRKCFLSNDPFELSPSAKWSNDRWIDSQDNRSFNENEGHWIINPGFSKGTIIGGNQCTLNLLQGTEYMPNISDSILFLEDDYEAHVATFDRDLQSIIHQPNFTNVKGIVIGRFQPESEMTRDLLAQIIKSKNELNSLPVVANVDFGHTTPQITFPIGGECEIELTSSKSKITISKH